MANKKEWLPIRLDKHDNTPLYVQLREHILLNDRRVLPTNTKVQFARHAIQSVDQGPGATPPPNPEERS